MVSCPDHLLETLTSPETGINNVYLLIITFLSCIFITKKVFKKINFYNHAHDLSTGRTSGKQVYTSSYQNVCDEILVYPYFQFYSINETLSWNCFQCCKNWYNHHLYFALNRMLKSLFFHVCFF